MSRKRSTRSILDDDATLAQHENRHVLTRSLCSGRQCEMELGQYTFNEDDCLLIATDGFWAELNGQQQREFRANRYVPSSSHSDDIRACIWSPPILQE